MEGSVRECERESVCENVCVCVCAFVFELQTTLTTRAMSVPHQYLPSFVLMWLCPNPSLHPRLEREQLLEQQRSLQDALDQLQAEAKFDVDQLWQHLEEKQQEIATQQAQITVSRPSFFTRHQPLPPEGRVWGVSCGLVVVTWGFCRVLMCCVS